MPERRANDVQVERLLYALKNDLTYRQDLARKLAKKDNIKYASAMRRLQRYITDAGEKRSFASAPKYYQREVRAEVRRTPPTIAPPSVTVRPKPASIFTPPPRRSLFEEDEEDEDEEESEEEGEFDSYEVHLNDLRAVIAYHDGNIKDTAQALGVNRRGERLLDYQITADEADLNISVLNMTGGGELQDGVRDFFNNAAPDTVEEIQTFAEIFFNKPDWQIGVVMNDLRGGFTTFADWWDAWELDGYDVDAQDSEYWALWREAYGRTKAA
jgi:hypothetical protein